MVRDPGRLLGRMPWGSLLPLIPGAESDRSRVVERLREFATELLRWNRGVSNLISHDDEPRLVERHIAESLAGAEIINALGCNELVDFGSGGGFPALPLAIAGVGSRWTLVESRRNKTLFLRRAVQELGLANVRVVTGRLEVLVHASGPTGPEAEPTADLRCDGFTSRATSRLGRRGSSFLRSTRRRARTWIVLPRPMSSARQAPRPSRERRWSHRTPTCW